MLIPEAQRLAIGKAASGRDQALCFTDALFVEMKYPPISRLRSTEIQGCFEMKHNRYTGCRHEVPLVVAGGIASIARNRQTKKKRVESGPAPGRGVPGKSHTHTQRLYTLG